MKNIFLLGLAIVLFTACETGDKRYTQKSPEIDTVKKLISNYNNKTYDLSIYADTSETSYNSSDKTLTPDETIAYHKANDAVYSSRSFVEKNQEYEMVVTDEGKTWVNFWSDWKGTLAATNKEVTIPIHLTYQFIDGKIVRESGYWDPTEIVLARQEIEAKKNRGVAEITAHDAIKKVTTAWNTNDKQKMASLMTNDFVRTENGNVIANNPAEYGTNLMDVFHGSFPDFKVHLNKTNIVGNKIHINWTCTGTNTKPFRGNAATNKPITTHGHSIWTIEKDGKFSREDAYYDNLTVFTQLGIPVPN